MYAFDTQTNKPRAPNSNSLLYQTLSHQDSLYAKLLCGTGQLKTIFLVQALWNYLNYPILNLIHMSMLPHSFLPVGSLQLTQSCPTLCNPMDWSTPGLPVHHQLLEITQTHIHRVSDGIQPYHPLSSPSPSAFNLSQHQGLFQWVSSSHQVAKVLEFQIPWTARRSNQSILKEIGPEYSLEGQMLKLELQYFLPVRTPVIALGCAIF